MIKAYNAVKNGSVKGPQAIRQIAATFEAIARDPQLSQKVSFDAQRAADTLYEQAEHQEDAYQGSTINGDVTQPNLRIQ